MEPMSLQDTDAANEVKPLDRLIPVYGGAAHGGSPVGRGTIGEAIDACLGKTKGMQARIMKMRSETNEKRQKALKLALPADTFGYNFNRSPALKFAKDLDRCTGVMALDFDNCSDPEQFRSALVGDPRTLAAYLSPRGVGVRVLCCWTPTRGGDELAEDYKLAEIEAGKYYESEYGEKVDIDARGMYRLSFRSWDPGGIVNKRCKPFKAVKAPTVEKVEKAEPREDDTGLLALGDRKELETLKSALASIDPTMDGRGGELADGIPNSRQTWVRIGIAIKSRFNGSLDAKSVFHEWSRNDLRRRRASWPKGVPATFGSVAQLEQQWASFARSGEAGRLGLGLIYKIATSEGWTQEVEVATKGEAIDADNWEKFLRRNARKTVKSCDFNAKLIMKHHAEFRGRIKWNEFLSHAEVTGDIPWIQSRDARTAWTDHDDKQAAELITKLYNPAIFDVAPVSRAVESVAKEARYHPVRDWLRSLTWDGVERLDGWLASAFGCEDTEYTRAVASKVLISAVARVEDPGVKVDTMLVVGGKQGLGKSTVFRALAGDAWFSDAELLVGTKDAAMLLRGAWIHEMGELHTLRRAEVTLLKSYLSRQIDRQRDAFEKHVADRPRQNIFVGTTNRREYLTDETGNRRFWPIWATKADFEWVEEAREQLWAEASVRWLAAEPWWLDRKMEKEAMRQQESRVEHDPWEDVLEAYLDGGGEFGEGGPMQAAASTELFAHALRISAPSFSDYRRAAAAMRRIGWKRGRVHIGKAAKNGYVRKARK